MRWSSAMADRLAALLWDVDGTLAETELEGHRPAFNEAFAELGLPWQWDESTYLRLLGVSGGGERIVAWSLEQEGHPPDANLLKRLLARKRVHYGERVRAGALPLRPGVAALIREAAAAGVRQAIVTTSGHAAVADLLAGLPTDLAAAFAFRICGEDVVAKKPDPQAYRFAHQRLGAVPAGAVLVLEDSRNGLAAARGAGLPCLVTLSSLSRTEPAELFRDAHAVVESLAVAEGSVRVRQGPACFGSSVTLSYLQSLLQP